VPECSLNNFVVFHFWQPSFLDLAFGAALMVFLLLEMIRVCFYWNICNFMIKILKFKSSFKRVSCTNNLVNGLLKVWEIWPLGKMVHQFMNAFTDHRDSDILIVRHVLFTFVNILFSESIDLCLLNTWNINHLQKLKKILLFFK
jgi:dolichol kinase